MSYATTIREHAAALGHLGANVAHIEAWMRVEHPTLDALSPAQFRAEVLAAIECVRAATPAENVALAEALGTVTPNAPAPSCPGCGEPSPCSCCCPTCGEADPTTHLDGCPSA